ncbi:MAG: hypothetical protein HRJ53_27235 [Acidobacteria bacterium Pan2503]|uniref:Uncharacterized protein n=1 Tax=Candidatus Acidiferrum panamense TaxID=2741543 RepID=A0A7V8NWC1_9BACT|nr:hypothetical protein [Candidatus Acidoferrum panamensis]
MRGAWVIAFIATALAGTPPKPLPKAAPIPKPKTAPAQQCVVGQPPPGYDCQGNPVYVANPIFWPVASEWTPRLYANVPTLTTSGQAFEKGTLLGGIQPKYSVLTYTLYQINLTLLMAGNGGCCRVLADNVTTGFSIRAHLQQGLCFVLTQEPGGMTMAEMYHALGDPIIQNGVITPTATAPYGGGAGGAPSGPGCAYPPPTPTPADIAAAYTDIYVG